MKQDMGCMMHLASRSAVSSRHRNKLMEIFKGDIRLAIPVEFAEIFLDEIRFQ
jgi:hypothetical protein